MRNSGTFVGFDQYSWILNDAKFWTALRNTFSIFLLSTIPQLILADLHRRDARPQHPRQDLLAHERAAALSSWRPSPSR